jgi:tetratricopeptide (TPR) repeat protein
MKRRVVAFLLISATGAGTPAFAVPPPGARAAPPVAPAKPKDRADELFDQGTAAADAGRLPEAEAKFREAWGLKQTHDIAGNLAIVERRLGKHREAAAHLTWALDHFPPTESSSARKALEQELKLARAELSALRVRLNVDGAEVTVNGRAAGSTPVAAEVLVDPGSVTIAARRDGYVAAEQTITMAKGESREVSLTMAAVVADAPRRSVVPGAVLGGVAGAALVTGIGLLAGFRAKSSTAQGQYDAILQAGNSCVTGAANHDPRCASLYGTASTGNTLQKAGVGALIGAGAAAAGTVVYFVLPSPRPGTPSSGGLHIVPALSPTAAGLVFSGVL